MLSALTPFLSHHRLSPAVWGDYNEGRFWGTTSHRLLDNHSAQLLNACWNTCHLVNIPGTCMPAGCWRSITVLCFCSLHSCTCVHTCIVYMCMNSQNTECMDTWWTRVVLLDNVLPSKGPWWREPPAVSQSCVSSPLQEPHQQGLVPRRAYWLLPSQRRHGMAISSSQTSLPLSSHFQLSALCDCTGRGAAALANTHHQKTGACRKNDSGASYFLSSMNQDHLQKACLTWSRARRPRNPTGTAGSWQHMGIIFRECDFFSWY